MCHEMFYGKNSYEFFAVKTWTFFVEILFDLQLTLKYSVYIEYCFFRWEL